MYRLRYYCYDEAYWQRWGDQDGNQVNQHHEILELLRQIQAIHGISYEVLTIPSNAEGWADDAAEQAFYREHIIPRSHVLIPRLGESSVRRAFKSRKGNLYLAGRVIILEDGDVGWATGTRSSLDRFLPSPTPKPWRPDELYFLEGVLQNGARLLSELCFPVQGTPEQRLLDRFKKARILSGDFRANVWIREGKQMDLICENPDHTWIIEGKTTLNWEAYGQIHGYTRLYRKAHPDVTIRSGIVCGKSDPVIQELCTNDNIVVFVETNSGFQRSDSGNSSQPFDTK